MVNIVAVTVDGTQLLVETPDEVPSGIGTRARSWDVSVEIDRIRMDAPPRDRLHPSGQATAWSSAPRCRRTPGGSDGEGRVFPRPRLRAVWNRTAASVVRTSVRPHPDVVPPFLLGCAALAASFGLLLGCGGPRAAAWVVQAPVGPNATFVPVTVFVGSSSCNRIDSVEVDETEGTVSITAKVRRSSGGDGGCTADMSAVAVAVDLNEPLGQRRLDGCGTPPGYLGGRRDCRLPITPGDSSTSSSVAPTDPLAVIESRSGSQ